MTPKNTKWDGYKNGVVVETYVDRWAAEHALRRGWVQSIAPQVQPGQETSR
jgi:hypothetical protein